ncbi:serine/threonine-protein kinase [Actinomadura gamaensis]|uniref:Serine/threonine-protein kinase n=1 Tax=Actinomadura gamaensis TaxID=1763541 RepID=A0ABV9TS25_9ACTN
MPAALRADDPDRLGRYELTGRLGAGGQGVVYAALAPDGRRVAVKLLRTGFGDDEEARGRFLRELDVAKRVRRFCTAAVLDADVTGDHPYIVSEYVDGPSLDEVVRAEGPRGGGALERLAVGTATALVAIHQAGVVHRDFKPQNVLLGPDGPRVIDFGIARFWEGATLVPSGVVGTPVYMAPEQLRGEWVGPATDVFAWAGTMVFASCGRPPFGDDTVPAVFGRVLGGEPDLGALTGTLRALASRCLAKDPAARPSSSEVLRSLLGDPDTADAELPAAAQQRVAEPEFGGDVPPWYTTRPSGKGGSRLPAVLSLVAAVVAVAAAGVVGGLLLASHGQRTPPAGGPTGARSALAPATAPASTPAPASPAPSSSSESPTEQTPSSAAPTATATPSPSAAAFSAQEAGTWSGQVLQSDGKVLPVTLTLPEGGTVGHVDYPAQRCSGDETLTGRTSGAMVLRENITAGADKCVPTGTLTLTPRQDGLYFDYYGVGRTRAWTVKGLLTRS